MHNFLNPGGLLPSTLIYPHRAGDIRALADSCFYTRLESAADRAFGAQRFSGGRSGRRFAPPLAGLRGFKGRQFSSETSEPSPETLESNLRERVGGWVRLGFVVFGPKLWSPAPKP